MKNAKINKRGFGIVLGLLALAAIGALGSWIGYEWDKVTHPVAENVGASFQTPEVRALFETSLASRITSSATSFTLVSATDKDGTALASSTYGFIFDEGTASEEMVLADCTSTTCTNASRGISTRTGTTSVAALQFAHNRGASVKITDGPSLIFAVNVLKGTQNIENKLTYNSVLTFASTSEQLASARFAANAANVASTSAVAKITGSANTFTALQTFNTLPQSGATPSNASDLTTKTYVDGVAVAGCANGSTSAKGCFEAATASEVIAGTATGGTGAALVITPDAFISAFGSNVPQVVSTTSLANMATTTLRGIPFGTHLSIDFAVASTSNQNLRMCFNPDMGGCNGTAATGLNYNMANTNQGVSGSQLNDKAYITLDGLGAGTRGMKAFYHFDIYNGTSTNKMGTGLGLQATSTDSGAGFTYGFYWASSTAAINSVAFAIDTAVGGNSIGAGTVISAVVLP